MAGLPMDLPRGPRATPTPGQGTADPSTTAIMPQQPVAVPPSAASAPTSWQTALFGPAAIAADADSQRLAAAGNYAGALGAGLRSGVDTLATTAARPYQVAAGLIGAGTAGAFHQYANFGRGLLGLSDAAPVVPSVVTPAQAAPAPSIAPVAPVTAAAPVAVAAPVQAGLPGYSTPAPQPQGQPISLRQASQYYGALLARENATQAHVNTTSRVELARMLNEKSAAEIARAGNDPTLRAQALANNIAGLITSVKPSVPDYATYGGGLPQ